MSRSFPTPPPDRQLTAALGLLRPLAEGSPELPWEEIAHACYLVAYYPDAAATVAARETLARHLVEPVTQKALAVLWRARLALEDAEAFEGGSLIELAVDVGGGVVDDLGEDVDLVEQVARARSRVLAIRAAAELIRERLRPTRTAKRSRATKRSA